MYGWGADMVGHDPPDKATGNKKQNNLALSTTPGIVWGMDQKIKSMSIGYDFCAVVNGERIRSCPQLGAEMPAE